MINKQTTINVNILAVILYYSFERCYYWEKLDECYMGSLCIISFIYDCFFEIQFIYNTTYPFKVYNSLVFVYSELWNQHHNH